MKGKIKNIFRLQLFNVDFEIYITSESDEQDYKNWIQLLKENPEKCRVSYILAWLEGRGIFYASKWSYCNKINLISNWRAYWGYRKQIKNLKYRIDIDLINA